MAMLRAFLVCGLALGLAACATSEPATRGAGLTPSALSEGLSGGATTMVQPDYSVVAVNIDVPQNLRVSEANSFFPMADIVWHGDPLGDRRLQVKSLFEEAFASGTADLHGSRGVTVEATLTRFHALTPKARYTVGGMHTIHFVLTVRDALTGEILDGPRQVVADVHGSGGARALEEEAAGLTQKMVIEQRLAQVIHDELTAPHAVPPAGANLLAVSRQAFSPTDLNIVQ